MADINLVQFYNAIQQGAREATLQVLESALADPATSAKQDTIKGVLDTLATESTLGDVKTATGALAALISNSRLKTEAQLTGRTSALAVTLANAVAIRDTNQYIYRLVEEGGLTPEQIRNASSLVVIVRSSLNQPGSLIVSPAYSPHSLQFTSGLRYYSNASFFSGSGGVTTTCFQPAGTADAPGAMGIIEIPGFAYPQSNVQVVVQFNSEPTSGAISIYAILGG